MSFNTLVASSRYGSVTQDLQPVLIHNAPAWRHHQRLQCVSCHRPKAQRYSSCGNLFWVSICLAIALFFFCSSWYFFRLSETILSLCFASHSALLWMVVNRALFLIRSVLDFLIGGSDRGRISSGCNQLLNFIPCQRIRIILLSDLCVLEDIGDVHICRYAT